MRLEEKYLWYKKYKRFTDFKRVVYKNKQFDEVVEKLNIQKSQFIYIYNKLNYYERLEFRNDYLDHLIKFKEEQVFGKFKELIENQILEVSADIAAALKVSPTTSLLSKKEALKRDVKIVKREIKATKQSIENQKQRAENGKKNMLAFEQRQLPILISKLTNIKNELKEVKMNIAEAKFIEPEFNIEVEEKQEVREAHKIDDLLQSIWLPQAKISVSDFLEVGIEKHIWSKDFEIITKRGSLFGTGKTLLGSLSIALKGFALSDNTDFKVVGKVFCKAFNIEVNEETKEPFKSFSVGNSKIIREFKREFKVK